MNKPYLSIVSLLLVCFFLLAGTPSAWAEPGDVSPAASPDGNVDVNDAVEVLRMVLGIRADKPSEADVSPYGKPDGIVDINDAVVILQRVLGIVADITVDANSLFVQLDTSLGEIIIKLDSVEAPISVSNFLSYVDSGFYGNLIFHRVIDGFMIQAGTATADLKVRVATQPAIKNEADNGVKNLRGTVAMARTSEIDSATSQFFINLADNSFLDHGVRDFGYAVFGRVTQGMDVVDEIGKVPTDSGDSPETMVVIQAAQRVIP